MKKLLSVFLSLCMFVGTLSVSFASYAAESITVNTSVYDGGVYTMEPTDISVTADLSDTYAAYVGYNDTSSQPTVLDAMIAAHIEMFGDDFNENSALSLYSSGWIKSAFGEESVNNMVYCINGGFLDSSVNINSTLADGDCLEFKFYQDTSKYSDKYTAFDCRELTVYPNEGFTLSLTATGCDDSGSVVTAAGSNYTVTLDGEATATTDSNGNVILSLPKTGEYVISATTESGYIFPAYCKVTVDENTLVDEVQTKIEDGASFLLKDTSELTVDTAVDYLTYLNSGYDMTAYNDGFINSVKSVLSSNGRLTTESTEMYSLGVYGAVIQSLRILGYDPSNFEGYDLVSQFESLDVTAVGSPYYYRVAIEAADEEFAKKLCDALVANYYTMGKGMAYYGYSCDNTAIFLTSIAKYKDSYSSYVSDALSIIDKHTADDGCFYSSDFSDTSPDSTAVVLMAYSALGETDRASVMYNNLVSEFESTNGVIQYYGADNAYATKEAVLAYEYFVELANSKAYDHILKLTKSTVKACTGGTRAYACTTCDKTVSFGYKATASHSYTTKLTAATTKKEGKSVTSCTVCGKVSKSTAIKKIKSVSLEYTKCVYAKTALKPAVTVKDSAGKTISSKYYTVKYSSNKNPGTATVTVTFKGNYSGTVKKTFTIVPKKTNLTKLTAGKKKFTVKWKKQKTQTTGYQIQYATDKKFKKNKKTVTIKKNKTTSKTIKNLKSKKKYYVRVRTYKTVDGKKYYSGWSTVKAVKTK